MTKPSITHFLSAFVGVMLVTGCATTHDPNETINRKVHGFNDSVDTYVAKPIADTYSWAVPELVQTGIFNFFNNLKDINVVINDLLQAKFKQSAEDAGRFIINTTVGLGGFVDAAKDAGLELHEEDFDQTLAVWGVPTGSYLVLPFLGPTTVRGIPSAVFDTAANPASWTGVPIQMAEMIDKRAKLQAAIDTSKEALDPYIFVREAFLQHRDYLAHDGKTQSATEFDDEISDDTHVKAPVKSKPDYALHLTPDTKESKQNLPSFSDRDKAFDNAAQQFGNAK